MPLIDMVFTCEMAGKIMSRLDNALRLTYFRVGRDLTDH